MAYDDNNIFARILRGEIPNKTIFENDHVLAFHDIAAKAPVHALVIPKGKYMNIADFGANASPEEITAFWRAVALVTNDLGVADTGFRMIANTGINGGQEVPHFHVHILGGKHIGPMVSE